MQKKAIKILKNKALFILGLLLSISILWPLFKPGYFTHHDDVQVIRLHQMDKCIRDFQIPCRWVPDLGGEYGYPLFNYYPPLPYYVGEVFYLITGNLLTSVKLMFALSAIGAYIFMYLFSREYWDERGAVLSAVFYSFVPYHAANLFVRGAMGELWAMMFFPAIFWSISLLYKKTNIINFVFVSIFSALLLTSHNISALIFYPLIISFSFLLFIKTKSKTSLLYSIYAILFSLILSAFYWVPAYFEKELVHINTMTAGYFGYSEHFKGIRKLLDTSWDWGASIRALPGGEEDASWFQVGWVHLISWFLAIVTSFVVYKKRKWSSYLIWFCSILILISIFLIHPRSIYIWDKITIFKYIQFPWRFLLIASFFISFLAGAVFKIIKKKELFFIIASILVVAGNFGYFKPEKFFNVTNEQLLTGEHWDKQIKRSIFDYLPIYAEMPPVELSNKDYEVISGEINVTNFSKGSDWFNMSVDVEDKGMLQISQYYFPNWKIFENNKELKIDFDNELGLMRIDLQKGNYRLKGKLFDTPIRKVSNVSSFIGLLVLFTLIIKHRFKKR